MKIYKIGEILGKLENCIAHNLPFSHIRFGDGGLKYMDSIINKDLDQLNIIVKKEGIPIDSVVEILELWAYYARRADFIDSPQVYFDGKFWPRLKTPTKGINAATKLKLLNWKDYYYRSEIDNEEYCNPESNYLMVLRLKKNKKNLLDMMKGRKVCIITAKPGIKNTLRKFGYDIDTLHIAGQYQNQYESSFNTMVNEIRLNAKKYDFWLVAAGELGRIYSGLIKENGGRCIDIGFVIEFWLGFELHPRLEDFMKRSKDNYLEAKLHKRGLQFRRYI